MNASVVEAVVEKLETLEAKLALCESVLRDVRQLARSALVGAPVASALDMEAIRERLETAKKWALAVRNANLATDPRAPKFIEAAGACASDVPSLLARVAQLESLHELAATLNSISTRIAAAQQALRVTEDAEHKRGHEKDDAELLAWAASVGLDNLEPASRLKAIAARRRQTLRAHGEELLRVNAADPTLARANDPDPIES